MGDKEETETNSIWTCVELAGRIIEAKNLIYPKTSVVLRQGFDLKVTVKLDSEQYPSYTTAFTRLFPSSWQEEFKFEAIPSFKNVSFILWGDKIELRSQNNLNENTLTPIGKIVIPQSNLLAFPINDEWLVLRDASLEARVTGQIQLTVDYYPQTGMISVSLLKGRDIDLGHAEPGPNTLVSFHLFPDPRAISTEVSHIQKGTFNPSFSEAFQFKFNSKSYENEHLHCAVWGQEDKKLTFLGQFTVPIKDAVESSIKEYWFTLSALPDDAIWENHLAAKALSKNETTEEFIKRFVQKIQDPFTASIPKAHEFQERAIVRGNCFVCDGKLMGSNLSCSSCSLSCHRKCQEDAGVTCGGVGLLKIASILTKTEVLDLSHYKTFLEIIQENDFEILLAATGKNGFSKEELAGSLFPVLGYNYISFLKLAIVAEVQSAESAKTLFRGNDFSSRGIFSLISRTCSSYLNKTLQNLILQIVNSKRSFEIDETKFDDAYKKHWGVSQCDVMLNMENLSNFLEMLINSIFNSAAFMPLELKELFCSIRNAAVIKFPNDENVIYTSVSGVFFLRIINAALISPEKYGIKMDKLNPFQLRKLLLISKVLQNLANFVVFANKEACMIPLNAFLHAKTEPMKHFIDIISHVEISKRSTRMIEYLESTEEMPEVVALACARVLAIMKKKGKELSGLKNYSKMRDAIDYLEKLKASANHSPLLAENDRPKSISLLSLEPLKSPIGSKAASKIKAQSFFYPQEEKANVHRASSFSTKKESNEKVNPGISRISTIQKKELSPPIFSSSLLSESKISDAVNEWSAMKADMLGALTDLKKANAFITEGKVSQEGSQREDVKVEVKELEKKIGQMEDRMKVWETEFLYSLKGLKEENMGVLESLEKEFDEFKEASMDIQKSNDDKISQILELVKTNHNSLANSIKQMDSSKVNFHNLESIRKDLKVALDETIDEINVSLKEALLEIAGVSSGRSGSQYGENRNSEALQGALPELKKEISEKLSKLEAEFVLFRQQANENITLITTRMTDFQDNINLNLDIQSRNMKRLDSSKVTYADLEGLRKDLKDSLEEVIECIAKEQPTTGNIEKAEMAFSSLPIPNQVENNNASKPITVQATARPNAAFSDIANYLYQDSSAVLIGDDRAPVNKATVKMQLQEEPQNAIQQRRRPLITKSRYEMQPSRQLNEINTKLAALQADFKQRRIFPAKAKDRKSDALS